MCQILQKILFEPNLESFSTTLRTTFSKKYIYFFGWGGMGRGGRKKPIIRKIQVLVQLTFSTISSV